MIQVDSLPTRLWGLEIRGSEAPLRSLVVCPNLRSAIRDVDRSGGGMGGKSEARAHPRRRPVRAWTGGPCNQGAITYLSQWRFPVVSRILK